MLLAMRLRKQLDQLAIERGQIVRLAAGHQVVVDDNFCVDPLGAGILQVSSQRRP